MPNQSLKYFKWREVDREKLSAKERSKIDRANIAHNIGLAAACLHLVGSLYAFASAFGVCHLPITSDYTTGVIIEGGLTILCLFGILLRNQYATLTLFLAILGVLLAPPISGVSLVWITVVLLGIGVYGDFLYAKIWRRQQAKRSYRIIQQYIFGLLIFVALFIISMPYLTPNNYQPDAPITVGACSIEFF